LPLACVAVKATSELLLLTIVGTSGFKGLARRAFRTHDRGLMVVLGSCGSNPREFLFGYGTGEFLSLLVQET